MKKNKIVSFFCGCGGLDLGFRGGFSYLGEKYKSNDFELISAYDIDEKCIQTYNQNIDAHAEIKDLSDFDVSEMPSCDVLIGGFPCQDFATCGPRKGLNSERGQLYQAQVKYMNHFQPKVVVAENVPGLANLNNGDDLRIILQDFENCGYTFQVWNMFAPNFGIAQSRTRLFLVGVRNDLKEFPVSPEPTHVNDFNPITHAIQDLEHIEDESVPNQSQYFKASKAKNGNGQGDEVSDPNKPSYTVRANAKSRVQFHYSLERRLTIRECARLQTFPDNFAFPHSATTNVMQIGNAVPPVLAHIVAKSISEFLQGVSDNGINRHYTHTQNIENVGRNSV